MHPERTRSLEGVAAAKRWRVELLTEIAEKRARQVEDDYRRAFDTHQLDAVVQSARRPRLAPSIVLLIGLLGLALTPIPPTWLWATSGYGDTRGIERPVS
ncbi:MAG: hypothetical protein EON93_16850 [Burkholderiales bacterium]|nr:MAG: hypothetical protein EON93_16850 [Burkholderiales bacterium]